MNKELNILAINTSSTSGSVAICKKGIITHISYMDIRVTHSQRLMPQIEIALNDSGISLKELDLICVAVGPGSFTGIRIGLATAKGLCYPHKIPLLAIDNLKLLANNLYGSKRAILSFIDARMSEVYAALYDKNLNEIIIAQNAKPKDFLKMITQPVIVVGDGALKYSDILEESNVDYIVAKPHQNVDLATSMLSIALDMELPKYDFEMIAKLEPNYLRKSQAEIEKSKREKK